MKRLGIYWMSQKTSELHRSRAELLEDIGYNVQFFSNFAELSEEIKSRRVSIVIVSDEGDESEVLKAISSLPNMPEIHGARLLFCASSGSINCQKSATLNSFRDIIQLDWDDHTWLKRFEFSTASQASDLELEDKLSRVNQSITCQLPARIAWLETERMWVESRARCPVETSFTLKGALMENAGYESIDYQVNDIVSNNLFFRYSQAMLSSCKDVPQAHEKMLKLAKQLDTKEKPKVFVAVQSPALRATILKYLDSDTFEVHTALQKKSLIMEPKFFSPHLVFIEDRLCAGEAMSRFLSMSSGLPESSCIVVVGNNDDLSSFKNFCAGRRLEALVRIPKNLKDLVFTSYLTGTEFGHFKTTRFHIPHDHPYSYAELEVKTKLIGIASDGIEIALPFPIESFGLVRLQNKTLCEAAGTDSIFAKVVALKERKNGQKTAILKFSSLDDAAQNRLMALMHAE